MTIRGSGGGGKGASGAPQRAPVEAADSLRSRQYAKVIDLLCEGEIVGLRAGLQSLFLNDTPVQNPDGSFNFTGVGLITRNGTQSQDYVPGFAAVETETPVSVEVLYVAPVVRTISNPNTNAVRVTLSVPLLTFQDQDNGDLVGTRVGIAIDVQTAGGGFIEVLNDTISGKTTSKYQREYRVELTGGVGPWDIRVRRQTLDSDTGFLKNSTFWDSYTEIIDAKLRYPNTALAAVTVDSEKFSSIPVRGYEAYGMYVRVPMNYNGTTRTYDGIWDGTFSYAWTTCPVWNLYDMIVEGRYGLGNYINADQIDKWAFYKIAQYCDELVSDGFGGVEHRFSCSLYIQTQEEAFRLINAFAAMFCGAVFWAGETLGASQDSPSAPVALFTKANIIERFKYTGSSVKSRHTVALVTWNDPKAGYKQKIEYVADEAGIARYGIKQTSVIAMGCTSRGQAHRFGRSILYTERMETETITFKTGLDGLAVMPGEVIQTSDPVRAGKRLGGRLISATTTVLELDSPVEMVVNVNYTVWAIMPDGSVESRMVVTEAGSVSTLTVATPFTNTPLPFSIWVFGSENLVPETWRVISISEVDETQAEIAALKYSPQKYTEIESGLILEPAATSALDVVPVAPSSIVVTEELYPVTQSVIGTRLTISWYGTAQYYELQYRGTGQNWTVVSTSSSSVDIQPVTPGDYEFSLVGINSVGRRSAVSKATATVYGLTAPASDVEDFNLQAIGGLAQFTFKASPDLDVRVGGYLRIRHTSVLVGGVWSDAVDIGSKIPGTATTATLPLLAGTYLAKWVDSSENESVNAVSIVTDAPNVLAMNTVTTLVEQPGWVGAKDHVAVLSGFLTLDSSDTIDSRLDLIDSWPLLSSLGDVSAEGTYYFSSGVDLGSIQTSRLTAKIKSVGYSMLDLIDSWSDIDSRTDFDGDVVNGVGCSIYIRTTNDNPVGAPVWSAWTPFTVSDYTARAFQFKAVLTTNSVVNNIFVTELEVTVDMPDRFESSTGIVSGTGVYSVVYLSPFMVPPAVGVTAQNMQTGDFYTETNKTRFGFDIQFKNAAGVGISRTFDPISKGY